MNKWSILSIAIASFLCHPIRLHADETTPNEMRSALKTTYVSAGVVQIYPYVGIGHRWQSGHNGADLSLSVTGGPLNIVFGKIDALYLFIPKPNPNSQFYLGSGIGINALGAYGSHFKSKYFLTPELALGYQYKTSKGKTRFAQIEPGICVWDSAHEWNLGPFITASYGFEF
jgi:hypothetical protein